MPLPLLACRDSQFTVFGRQTPHLPLSTPYTAHAVPCPTGLTLQPGVGWQTWLSLGERCLHKQQARKGHGSKKGKGSTCFYPSCTDSPQRATPSASIKSACPREGGLHQQEYLSQHWQLPSGSYLVLPCTYMLILYLLHTHTPCWLNCRASALITSYPSGRKYRLSLVFYTVLWNKCIEESKRHVVIQHLKSKVIAVTQWHIET